MSSAIQSVQVRQILDSRDDPTVEVDIVLADGSFGRAAAPSGASTGAREALELRDGGNDYLGKGVLQAVKNVKEIITPQIIGKAFSQEEFDQHLIDLDGTPNKSRLGANAILPVSMAYAVAEAQSQHLPLYRHIGELVGNAQFGLPKPMFNIMNGGAHANWTTDIQEYMILPVSQDSYEDHLRKATEVFDYLAEVLKSQGLSVQVGNEGGYAPDLQSNTQSFELILEAIEKAGFKVGQDGDFILGVDIAASEFYQNGLYTLRRDGKTFTSVQMIEWVTQLTRQYPIFSLEDPLAESDWAAWTELTAQLDSHYQIVGDDLLVTNTQYIERGIAEKSCNAIIIKPNQVGTVTETLAAISMAQNAGWKAIPSHRSGETEDTFITHLAVGTNAGQIKTGAPSRTDRTAKYNELLRIAETL